MSTLLPTYPYKSLCRPFLHSFHNWTASWASHSGLAYFDESTTDFGTFNTVPCWSPEDSPRSEPNAACWMDGRQLALSRFRNQVSKLDTPPKTSSRVATCRRDTSLVEKGDEDTQACVALQISSRIVVAQKPVMGIFLHCRFAMLGVNQKRERTYFGIRNFKSKWTEFPVCSIHHVATMVIPFRPSSDPISTW